MKSKFTRILGVGLTIAVLASLMAVAGPVPVAGANLAYSVVSTPGRSILGGFDLNFMVAAPDGKTLFFYSNPTKTTTLVGAATNSTGSATGTNVTSISSGDNVSLIMVNSTALGTLARSTITVDGESFRLTSTNATGDGPTLVTYSVETKYTTQPATHTSGTAVADTDWWVPGKIASAAHANGIAVANGGALYRSTNSGSSWSTTGGIGTGLEGVKVVDLAISPNYATDKAVVAVSTTNVFYSGDGGLTFASVVPSDLVTKLEGGTITSVAVGPYWKDGKLNIIIGVKGGTTTFSNVLRFDVTQFGGWTGIGTFSASDQVFTGDVLDIAFSPTHLSDAEFLAVTVNTTAGKTFLNTHFSVDTDAWDARFSAVAGDLYPVELNSDDSATPIVSFAATAATIAFGSDFSGMSSSSLLVGTQDAGPIGGVIRVSSLGDTSKKSLNLLTGKVSSIAISGPIATGNVLVGMVGSKTVSRTSGVTASTVTWTDSSKHPTGTGGITSVLWIGGNATAGTTGDDAAYSMSYDGGVSFNQLGAIDVKSASGMSLVDAAIVDANTMFVIMNNSAGGTFVARSLFRTDNGGNAWVRILTGATLENVVASANYTSDKTIYVTDSTANILKSTDGGNTTFTTEFQPANVKSIALVSKDDYFVGGSGQFFRKGSFTSATGITGTVRSIALSPAFATDKTVLVGNDIGSVFISTDAGVTFSGLGSGSSLGASDTYVAFDPGFARNKTVFAAGADTTAGFKRATTTTGTWVQLSTGNASKSGGLAVSSRGTIYVANNREDQAILRSLTPLATIAGTTATEAEQKDLGISTMFGVETWKGDTLPTTNQLPWGASLTKLTLSGANALYAIAMGQSDQPTSPGGSEGVLGVHLGYKDRLLTLTDTLAPTSATATGAPAPVGPASTATVTPALETPYWANLSWRAVAGANAYQVRYSENSTFPTDASVAAVYTVNVKPTVVGGVPPTTLTIGAKDAEGTQADADKVTTGLQTDAGAGNQAAGTTLTALKSGKKYFWQIRVTEPEPSPWSTAGSFYTALPAMTDPGAKPGLDSPYSPRIGEMNVSVTPTFVWPTVKGATNYEFMIGEDPTFAIIDYSVNTGKLNTHATDPKEPLLYSTVYYWRVRGTTDLPVAATKLAQGGDWATLSFTTMAKPSEAAAKAAEPVIITQPGKTEVQVVQVPVEKIVPQAIPSYLLWAIIFIGAVLIIALIILIVRTRKVT
ncbi:MAG: hypothetical protein HY663_02360 [Chloroflexi bacterium]|nr:hypothetical protein [Chloroflexota bacterium]